MPPRSVASKLASAPPSLPKGVRAAPRITVCGILSNLDSVGLAAVRRPTVSLTHARRRLYCRPDARLLPPGRPADTDADTLCVGLFEGDEAPAALDEALGGELGRLIESGEAKGAFKKTAIAASRGRDRRRARDRRGPRQARRVRRPSARASPRRSALGRARDAGAKRVAWAVPGGRRRRPRSRAALAEGALLAAYRFDRYKTSEQRRRRRQGPERARDRRPSEDLSARRSARPTSWPSTRTPRATCRTCRRTTSRPAKLAEHALRARGRDRGPRGRGLRPRRDRSSARWAACSSVAQGSHEEPRFIVLRYDGGGGGQLLALVGKAVTFDTGGISIKPSGEDAGDEDGHVGRVRGDRGDRRDRPARASRQPAERRARDREHALRSRDQAGRHHPRSRTARRSRSTTPTPRAG